MASQSPTVEELQARIAVLEGDLDYYRETYREQTTALEGIAAHVDQWRDAERRRDERIRSGGDQR
jgi:hypothetical protein